MIIGNREPTKNKESRNINVSLNRANSINPPHHTSQNIPSNNRKVQSVSSKNIHRVGGNSHSNQQSEDFKSSRRLSYCPDSEAKPVSYQVLSNHPSQTPNNYAGTMPQGFTPTEFKQRTPISDINKYHSQRYAEGGKGKTAPCSAHHSQERNGSIGSESNEVMMKKFNSHSNANILQYSNPDPSTLKTPLHHQQQPITGYIGIAPGLPKRSGSQKIRGNSQHFLKRKEGISVLESQQNEIAEALRKKLLSEQRSESNPERKEKKVQDPAVPVKQTPPSPEGSGKK